MVEGATISVKQGKPRLACRSMRASSSRAPYIVFDVPPGDTTVTATFETRPFLGHVVKSVAGVTANGVRPGY